MTEQTNEDLMTQAVEGNTEALGILFERHHVHVFNFLYKMCGDKVLSEDITQEVFYKLIKYRSSYKQGSFISWLFTITRNSLKTHYRRNKENHTSIREEEYRLSQSIEDKSEAYSHLHKALNQLNTVDREILVLNRLQGIKYNELAEILDSTPGAVKTKASRALEKLKRVYFQNI